MNRRVRDTLSGLLAYALVGGWLLTGLLAVHAEQAPLTHLPGSAPRRQDLSVTVPVQPGLVRGADLGAQPEENLGRKPRPADPVAWGVHPEAVEVIERRARGAKHFRNPDGTYTAVFGHFFHYEAAPGIWQDVDLTFRPDGSDYVMDQHVLGVRVSRAGVAVYEQASGKGIRWRTPMRPRVSGRQARFEADGLTWEYRTRTSGLKLAAVVKAPRGAQTYEFAYELLGGAQALVLANDGSLVSDVFQVPQAVMLGADHRTYACEPWRLTPGNRISTRCDDAELPSEAYPYELDPTTTFSVAASEDDGYITNGGSPDTGGTEMLVQRTFSDPAYFTSVSLMRWDTSSIPDGETIQGATLRIYVKDKKDFNDRSLTADWYTAWPIDFSDYTATAQTSALAGSDLTAITTSADNDFALSGYATDVSTTSYTGLRLHISGSTPTSLNSIIIAAFEDNALAEPRLIVTYIGPPSITAFSHAPEPAAVGDGIYFAAQWTADGYTGPVKAHFCKTNAITPSASGGSCPGGTWASSASTTSANPIYVGPYTAQSADSGGIAYYAFVCDDASRCSAASTRTVTFGGTANAPTFDAATTATQGNGASLTFSHTVGSAADRLLIVAISYRTSQASTVKYENANLTLIRRDTNGTQRTELWYLLNPATGANNVVITWAGDVASDEERVATAISYTGVNQTAPLGSDSGNTGNSTTPSAVVPTTRTDEVVLAVGSFVPGSSCTTNTGHTQRWAATGPGSLVRGSGAEISGKSATWSCASSGVWAVSAVAIKPADAPWYNTNWLYRQKLTVRHTMVSKPDSLFSQGGDVGSFLVYVNLADLSTGFFSHVKADGSDIVVTQSNGMTKLSRELVSINTGASTGELWFRAPTLYAKRHTEFYIYYGNAAASETNSTGMWSGFPILARGVWHLNDLTTSTTADSTGNTNNGTKTAANEPVEAAGQVGRAQSLDGINDAIRLSEPPASSTNLTGGSVFAWIKTSNAGTSHRGIAVKQHAYGMFLQDNVFMIFDFSAGADRSTGINLADGLWHYVGFTFDSGVTNGTILYVDGIARLTTTMTVSNQNEGFIIGAGDNPGTIQLFAGSIDEVQLYASIRSGDWIKTSYNNQNNPAKFYFFGGEQPLNPQTTLENATWENATINAR